MPCNTRAQVERFVALNNADPRTAIRAVNAEQNDPSACLVAGVAYLRCSGVAAIRRREAAFRIVKILVIGTVTPEGLRPAAPTIYFALFRIDGRTAGALSDCPQS